MLAFSCAWWLPVTWQKWRSHHSICHSRKSHAACKLNGRILWKRIYCRSKFAGIVCSIFFASVTLTLTRWPSYTNLTRIPSRYAGCAIKNFLHQGFRKLSYYKQTDVTEITVCLKKTFPTFLAVTRESVDGFS